MRWPLYVIKTVLTGAVGVAATVVAVAMILVLVAIDRTSPSIDKIIRRWSRLWLLSSGTSLEVEGRELVEPSRSYVVVANHLSTLDIMACLLAVPVPIRFLAKKELFRIPVLAQGMRAVGIIEVDRAARGAIHSEVNRQAKELIQANRSLIIYPEGTRPRDGVMRPFKKGAFTMAIAGQLPILPVSLHGSYEAWPPGQPWVRGGHIAVIIDQPIETSGMSHADTGQLRDRVREIIAKRVAEMGGSVADSG
jgi:1-acyl-sn-glycerol-3-phosphate acyltransferase